MLRSVTVRKRLYEILEVADYHDLPSRVFDVFLSALILVNLLGVVLGSMDSLHVRLATPLDYLQQVSLTLFTLEYLLRVWSCPDHPSGRFRDPFTGRLRYLISPLMVIDLLVLLAWYLPLPVGPDLRLLRIFRLLTLLRITHNSRPLQILIRVAEREWRTVVALVIVMLSLLLLTASLMYTVERETQPDAFGSIPAALWWAMATLTTVGYGDVIPHTVTGKIFGVLIMFTGIAMFAIPTGILVSSFAQEVKRRDFIATWNLVAQVPLFVRLNVQEVAAISDLLHMRTAVPNEVIFEKGAEGDAMYFIVTGEIEIALEANTLILHGGKFFGELALLYKQPRAGSARARTYSELLLLEARDFETFLESHPRLREGITQEAEKRRARDARAGMKS
jgi:voltage-gated potassium channel